MWVEWLRRKRMAIDGTMDRPEDAMSMELRGFRGGHTIEMNRQDGLTLGRSRPTDDWVEVDGGTDLFAPGGDPLGFLVAAENIENLGRDSRAGISYTRYGFDLNGVAYATYMKAQMEEELRRKGELPAGVNMSLIRQYVDMEGHGEIWVNQAGLPVRQLLYVAYPPEKGANTWVSADLTTDFMNWGPADPVNQFFWIIPRLVDNPQILVDDPLSLIPNPPSITEKSMQQFGFLLGLSLLLVGLMVLSVTHRNSQKFLCRRLYRGYLLHAYHPRSCSRINCMPLTANNKLNRPTNNINET